jgi:hypothetical protein
VRWLRIGRDADGEEREIEVRIAALEAGLREIDALGAKARSAEEREVLERLRDEYVHRMEHLRSHAAGRSGDESPASRFDHDAQTAALQAERRAIMDLRDRGEIPDDVFRTVQYDLDLAETRLF